MNFKKTAAFTASIVIASMSVAVPYDKSENSGSIFSQLKMLGADVTPFAAEAAETSVMRRPCSSESPMWIVHIDSWNYADPAKIIDLIPEDVLPYVVFNISLSINWDSQNHKWLMVQDGYETAKSWLRTCADKGVWTMIQPSSGGQSHFPDYNSSTDYENTIFAEFFRDYPNFIGYNYCEQFWGFESADFPITCQQRYQHFAELLKLCNKYGGYLDVSWCANQWSAGINPIAMLKTVPEWADACKKYSDNFILEEKYTQASYIQDVESEVYGAFISGYCGNFGVRYDETGWTDSTWSGTGVSAKDQYRLSTGLPIHLERMALNGATVIDGPELVWADDFKETWGYNDSDGYHVREWAMHDQYQNTVIDLFRKVQDGTVRIPDRKEVIDRTEVVIIQDVNSGNNDDKYSTYPTLFEGLYRMGNDGNLKDNHNLFKSTGRYQTIPTVYELKDNLAKSIPVQVKQSQISSRWATIEAKTEEFNKLYQSDYWGNCYAGRNENTWLAYNPNKDGSAAGGFLSLRYNTCKELECTFSEYGTAVINEYTDHIDFYANNYDEENKTALKTTVFKISGCSSEPVITYSKDRGVNQAKSEISSSYSDGTYTITLKHNGPVDISVKCSGNESNRQTSYKTAQLKEPEFPDFYTGIRQYEGEFFDSKNIEGNVTNGCSSGITGYWGQGFLKFGTKANAAVKDTVTTSESGDFDINLRYSSAADINNLTLYVNGSEAGKLSLKKGSSLSDWKTLKQTVALKKGENTIELKASSELAGNLYIDCFTVEGNFGNASDKDPEPINGTIIKNLIVKDKEHYSGWSIYNNFNKNSVLFGDRDFVCTELPSNLIGAEAIKPACDSKLVQSELAEFTVSEDAVIYAAADSRITDNLPQWLKDWTNSGNKITTSNDLTLILYKKAFKAGETVTLGTNGANTDSVNYIVLAVRQDKDVLIGDVNSDGDIDCFDVSAAKYGMIKGFSDNISEYAADVNQDGTVDFNDIKQLKAYIMGEISEFKTSQK